MKTTDEINEALDDIKDMIKEYRSENRRLRDALATIILCKESNVEAKPLRMTLKEFAKLTLSEGSEFSNEDD